MNKQFLKIDQMDALENGAVQAELPVIPGFRFYPTEEEIVGFYLKKQVQGDVHQLNLDLIIPTLDLYRYDPWDLPGTSLSTYSLVLI